MDSATRFKDLLSSEIESVKLEHDPNGAVRVILEGDELKAVNAYLKSELSRTQDEYAALWSESIENLETYRCAKKPLEDGGKAVYPAPIARIPADQKAASTYNSIVRQRPIFKIDAYLPIVYNVPQAPKPTPGIPLGPIPTIEIDSEKVAQNWQKGYDFVLRERVGFPAKLNKGINGAVRGTPYWWKVVANPQEKTVQYPKVNGILVDLNDKYEETKQRGDLVQWYLVPFTNAMKPVDEDDIDSSAWFAERTPWRPNELLKKYETGQLFLVGDDEAAERLAKTTADIYDTHKARAIATTQKTVAQSPTQICPVWLTWFYWDVKYTDLQDGQKKIKRLSLLGDFHLTTGDLMNCFINPYEHQCRPYELVDEMDDNDSTVGRMKFHQHAATYCFQSEFKNSHTANELIAWHDPDDSRLADFFAGNPVLGKGGTSNVPGKFGEQWGMERAGADHSTMLPLIQTIVQMSQLDSRENEFTMGGRPPGRTPAQTVAQVYEHAGETKVLFLSRLSSKLSRLLRLDAETRRQYQPLGEILPMWDESEKRTIEVPFTFPVGDVMDNFRMALTAADIELAREGDLEQIAMKKNVAMQDAEFIAKIMAAILNLQTPLPPSGVAIYKKAMKRDQKFMRQIVGMSVSDPNDYDFSDEIDAFVNERNAQLMMIQHQQALAQQQGGMNAGGPNPQGGAALPGQPSGVSSSAPPGAGAQRPISIPAGTAQAQGAPIQPGQGGEQIQ